MKYSSNIFFHIKMLDNRMILTNSHITFHFYFLCLSLDVAVPDVLGYFFSAEPAATILGGPDLYVDKGSTINLTCTIRFGPEPPGYIFWYHENKVSTFSYIIFFGGRSSFLSLLSFGRIVIYSDLDIHLFG